MMVVEEEEEMGEELVIVDDVEYGGHRLVLFGWCLTLVLVCGKRKEERVGTFWFSGYRRD
jgi:hypothetical protein